MGGHIRQQNEKKVVNSATLRRPFQVLTTTLLSLLLPLSFLLLARLTIARYLLDFNSNNPTSQPFSVLLYTNPTLLHGLVAIVCVSCLVHGLSNGRITPSRETPEPIVRSRLYTAWIFLCTFQVFVGLGVEGSIGAGVDGGSYFGYQRSSLSRVVFFLGLHETMLYWSRTVVKPVVDDTVFGSTREERWVERVVMAASFSTLWWWRLKDEVEAVVVVAEVKRELLTGVGVADFVGWWLYYLTVTIGMVRVVKGILWVGMVLLDSKRAERNAAGKTCENDEKV